MLTLSFARFAALHDPMAHPIETQWPGPFVDPDELLLVEHKDDAPLWSPAILHDVRDAIARDNVQAVTALVFDFDDVPAERVQDGLAVFSDYDYVVHSSFSHDPTPAEGPSTWKLRIIAPFSPPATPEQHARLWSHFASAIKTATGSTVDVSCKDPSRRYFWRSCIPTRQHLAFSERHAGRLLDPGMRLQSAAAAAPSTGPVNPLELLRARRAAAAATTTPAETAATTATPAEQTTTTTTTGLSIFRRAELAQQARRSTIQQDRSIDLIEAHCGFMRNARDLAATRISEPEWKAAISVWLLCEDGDHLVHERSSPDPRYDHNQTQQKLEQTRRAMTDQGIGPATCLHLRALSGPCSKACETCPLGEPRGTIRSPVVLGVRPELAEQRAHAAEERVAAIDDRLKTAKDEDTRRSLRAERAEANKERAAATAAVTTSVVVANAAQAGARAFIRGDHTELCLALIDDLCAEATGPSPVMHADRLYTYTAVATGGDGLWHPLPGHALETRVSSFAGSMVMQPKPHALSINRKDQSGVAAMVEAAIKTITPNPLPTAEGVAFQDGLLLPNGTHRPYLPGDYVLESYALPTPYLDPTTSLPPPPPARFLQFLHEVYAGEADVPERIAVLQEFFGAALFGIATRYQRSLLLLGETGSNGKSVLLKVAGRLFPTPAVGAITPHQLAGSGNSSEYYRAMLLRLRINIVSELPEQELMDTSTLKAVIAGDEIIAREIRATPFSGRPVAAWIVAANGLPPVRDTSGGFWRRQLILTHNNTFKGAAADPHLADKLLAELPAIAAWSAEGGRRLLATGNYTALPSSDATVDAWARDNDPVRRFIEDHLEAATTASPTDGCLAGKLYEAYRSWCTNNGNAPAASQRFFKRLAQLGHTARHTKAGNVYPVRIVALPGFSVATPSTKPPTHKVAEA